MSQFQQDSDSVSLSKIAGQKFTIVKIDDSNYEKDGHVTQGVKITTKESFDVDGSQQNKFHTTRKTLVNKLRDDNLRSQVNAGTPLGPVKCQLEKAKKGGNDYFILVDA